MEWILVCWVYHKPSSSWIVKRQKHERDLPADGSLCGAGRREQKDPALLRRDRPVPARLCQRKGLPVLFSLPAGPAGPDRDPQGPGGAPEGDRGIPERRRPGPGGPDPDPPEPGAGPPHRPADPAQGPAGDAAPAEPGVSGRVRQGPAAAASGAGAHCRADGPGRDGEQPGPDRQLPDRRPRHRPVWGRGGALPLPEAGGRADPGPRRGVPLPVRDGAGPPGLGLAGQPPAAAAGLGRRPRPAAGRACLRGILRPGRERRGWQGPRAPLHPDAHM